MSRDAAASPGLAKAVVGYGCGLVRRFVLRDVSTGGRTSSSTMEIKLHCANPTQLFLCSLMHAIRCSMENRLLGCPMSLSEPRPHDSQHKLELLSGGQEHQRWVLHTWACVLSGMCSLATARPLGQCCWAGIVPTWPCLQQGPWVMPGCVFYIHQSRSQVPPGLHEHGHGGRGKEGVTAETRRTWVPSPAPPLVPQVYHHSPTAKRRQLFEGQFPAMSSMGSWFPLLLFHGFTVPWSRKAAARSLSRGCCSSAALLWHMAESGRGGQGGMLKMRPSAGP